MELLLQNRSQLDRLGVIYMQVDVKKVTVNASLLEAREQLHISVGTPLSNSTDGSYT